VNRRRGPLAGRRVLVLEDEYFIAEDLAQALDAAGATVVGPFGNMESALAALAGRPELDVGILDVNLQGRRSYAVAEALQERGVPFIFLTGYDSPAIDAAWSQTPICHKPFDPARLLRILAGRETQP
jgi:DNA-binding NtrC family response regulator